MPGRVTGPKRRQPSVTADIFGQRSRLADSVRHSLGAKAFFRAHDALDLGVDSRALRRLADEGSVKRVARDLYHFAETEPTEYLTVAAVCARSAPRSPPKPAHLVAEHSRQMILRGLVPMSHAADHEIDGQRQTEGRDDLMHILQPFDVEPHAKSPRQSGRHARKH